MSLYHKVAGLYYRTLATNMLFLLVAVICYADDFNWLMTPLSWLGKLVTDNGCANIPALLVFCGAMIFNSVMWWRGCNLIAGTAYGQQTHTTIFSWMVFSGFPLMALPCDQFVLLHSFGGALLVGGLWAFTSGVLWHCRNLFPSCKHLGLHSALHATALFCGVNFFLDTSLKGMSQRPLLLAIVAVLAMTLRVCCHWESESVVVSSPRRFPVNRRA